MDLRISPASMRDVIFANGLAQENMRHYYERYDLEWNSDDFSQEWNALESYVIFEANTQVGFLSLSMHCANLYIRDIQITEKYTGQGIGTWVISQITSIAKKRNLQSIRLKVFNDNPAKSLYQRLGFLVVGSEPNLLRMERGVAP